MHTVDVIGFLPLYLQLSGYSNFLSLCVVFCSGDMQKLYIGMCNFYVNFFLHGF